MSYDLNKSYLCGNIGAEPELRTTSGGLQVLTFRLATHESYLDKEGQKQERTDWHTITMFGKRAESLSRHLSKGTRVFVDGRMHTSSYEKEGIKRSKTEVIANEICLSPKDLTANRDDGPLGRPNFAPSANGAHATNGGYARPPVAAADLGAIDLPF